MSDLGFLENLITSLLWPLLKLSLCLFALRYLHRVDFDWRFDQRLWARHLRKVRPCLSFGCQTKDVVATLIHFGPYRCFTAWMLSHSSCPMCKTKVAKGGVSVTGVFETAHQRASLG